MSPITLHESPDSGRVVHIQSVNRSVHKLLDSDRFSAVQFHRLLSFRQLDQHVATVVVACVELYSESPHDFVVYPVA